MPNVAQKIIAEHLLEGEMKPGAEIALKIDQTLTQDATGTLVMLELEAMKLDYARTELSAQYVDHNLLQEDFRNQEDHLFLHSACQRFGLWYSRPGNGVSHPVHQENFGKPGKTLLGSDSHTPAAGAIGMLAIGAGGLEVGLAIAGQPFWVKMPEIWGVKLTGELPDWVSAKDVILEMLRRHGVKGGVGKIIEYYGPGLDCLSAMDRHVITNMGAELGATTSVFPADDEVRRFLKAQGREEDFEAIVPDDETSYDLHEEINLSELEPLIAMPTSPGNVKTVREVAGEKICQAYVGSSANPGYRDFAVVSEIMKDRQAAPTVSLDINPSSRQILENLTRDGHLTNLLHAGARIHQAGCNGCIGMGQAPATKLYSLRTVPRNFPGRSGTREDKVCLVSPETAAASALTGVITDPRTLDMPYPRVKEPEQAARNTKMLVPPPSREESAKVELVKGENIVSIPEFEDLPDALTLPVLLKMGDDVSTDEILPAGSRVLPFRSNIPRISDFAFDIIDQTYSKRARDVRDSDNGGHMIIGGRNYGQGSSREHAALAPRYLGLRIAVAISYARIHWQNLANFGVLPLRFAEEGDYDALEQGDVLAFSGLRNTLQNGGAIEAKRENDGKTFAFQHDLSKRQIEHILAGGLINWTSQRLKQERG